MALRAGITFSDPRVSVTYTQPVAKVAYVLLAASMYEDESGLFRFVPDAVVMSDGLAILLSKSAADNVLLDDSTTLDVAKSLTDSVSMSETFVTVLIFLRDFVESVTATDVVSRSVDKPFSEAQAIADNQVASFTKLLTDGVAINDGFGAEDGFDFVFSTSVSNIAFASDSAVLSLLPAYSETVSTTDSGFVISQDYCNLTYFSQDYVGSAVTF